ncbi:mas-related G-protein coupled receptor member B1-like [Acomys russatus]|uniref:mas-related G-protein coupled receptor member B1-like n=1 Tax=Acomys russatus TaxID=60746 RepID=UPI0021E27C09|nr:mas-related G-protein coupled receptor member B1-like [Acomys russatus]
MCFYRNRGHKSSHDSIVGWQTELLEAAEPRITSGEFISMGPTGPTWRTSITAVKGSNDMSPSSCNTTRFTLNFLTVIIALVGMAGNATVLLLLGFHLRKNAFSVYILNLAGADFFFLCFQSVHSLQNIIHKFIPIYIPSFYTVLFNFAYLAGLSIISAISTERCLSTLFPIWYRCRRPRYTSGVMCVLLWALSLVLSFLQGEACMAVFNGFLGGWCRKLDSIIFSWLIVLFVVLLGSSLTLLLRVFCGSHRIPFTKLYVTIALTVLVFLLFGLSYGIHWFLLVEEFQNFDINLPCNTYEIAVLLSCINSCANPIIYFLVGSIRHCRFQKQALKLILQRAMQDTPEDGKGRERISSGKSAELETV